MNSVDLGVYDIKWFQIYEAAQRKNQDLAKKDELKWMEKMTNRLVEIMKTEEGRKAINEHRARIGLPPW